MIPDIARSTHPPSDRRVFEINSGYPLNASSRFLQRIHFGKVLQDPQHLEKPEQIFGLNIKQQQKSATAVREKLDVGEVLLLIPSPAREISSPSGQLGGGHKA